MVLVYFCVESLTWDWRLDYTASTWLQCLLRALCVSCGVHTCLVAVYWSSQTLLMHRESFPKRITGIVFRCVGLKSNIELRISLTSHLQGSYSTTCIWTLLTSLLWNNYLEHNRFLLILAANLCCNLSETYEISISCLYHIQNNLILDINIT